VVSSGGGARAEKIAGILAERARNVQIAEGLSRELTEIAGAVRELDQIRLDLLPRVEDDARDSLNSWAVPLRDIAEQVRLEQAALDRRLARLRRPTLNIGIVGRAGQGKSRFLQSLTGLTSREIPDGRSGFCTGVPSMIQHVSGGQTYADVFFHSQASFRDEVIGPYYPELGLGAVPMTPGEFGTRELPKLRPGADDGKAGDKTRNEERYRHLRAYHDNYGSYQDLIGATSPRRITPGEIRSFVAQDDEAGQQEYHAFRAVRRVSIATPFPRDDLSGVAVIDLPGLGDTNLGDSRILLAALQDDVDMVLFLRRPNPERDDIHDTDIALYSTARTALPEIPMERRSFLILNHRRSADKDLDNYARCVAFRDAVAGSAFRVVGAEIADCSSEAEVDQAFAPVVDYLLANIGELDRMLLDERARRLEEIRQEARLLVRDAAKLGALAQPASKWFPVFQKLFGMAHEELSVGIEDLVAAYRRERDNPDPAFAEAVRGALERAEEDTGIPEAEAIRRAFALRGGRHEAYLHLLEETRAHLSQHFLGLETALRETVRQMWLRVADVLRQAGELARLGEADGVQFLSLLAERVDPAVVGDKGAGQVKRALQMLIEFELSYRGFIQHRVRPSLDRVYGDTPLIGWPDEGPSPDEKDVREMLEETYRAALFNVETALHDLLPEPNRAVFAIVEEFRDRVLRARDVDQEWMAIYQDLRADIWADKFAALGENAVHLRTWNEAVQRLAAMADGGNS
jgi:hypothetical protein